MKRALCIILILAMVLPLFPVMALAATYSGSCGGDLTWSYDSATGALQISGTGPMTDFSISEVPWYDHRSAIRSVVIDRGVTTIGRNAFYQCRALHSVSLPNTLTAIGQNGFGNCMALTDVKLPASLRTIGDSAFYWCTSLGQIIIPEGVTVIEEDAFHTCKAATTLSLPSTVKTIGKGAFRACQNLTSAVVPNGVTALADDVFRECTRLVSVTLPNTITTIGESTFRECTSLTSIDLPDRLVSMSWFTFCDCTKLETVMLPKSMASIHAYAFYDCSALKDVYYGGTAEQWKVLSEKSGVDTEDSMQWLRKATIHFTTEEPQDGVLLRHNGVVYDLLSQPVNIANGSDAQVEICVNKEVSTGERIWLSQNTTAAVELTTGVWETIKPAERFNPDADIYLLIVNEQTGEARSEKTRLKVLGDDIGGEWMPSGNTGGLNFKLGNEIGFTIPEDIAVFGGTEIKWDLDFIPISVEYDREDSNKVNVVFGTNIATQSGEDGKTEYFSDFDFDGYKQAVKKAASKQGRTLKQLRNDFKMSNKQTMNLFGGKVLGGGSGKTGADLNVAGYAEMKVIDGQLTFIEGQLCLEAEVSATYQGQLFIWVVPIYYEIGANAGGGLEGTMVNIAPDTFVPEFEAYLTAKIGADLGAGLGVAGAATVGVSGSGSLNLKKSLEDEYLKVWGEGGADFNVKLLGKVVAEKPFAKGDFLIYETGNPEGVLGGVALAAFEDDGLYAAIDPDQIYANESRDYLASSAEWYGSYPPVSLLAVDYTNKNLQLLAENVYTESAPMVCDIDGQKVMVMLWDDEDRADIDRTMLVWSLYDEENETWSEPAAVHNDGTADFYPAFKDGWVVWQNQKTVMEDTMTLANIAALGEINAAKWNGAGFDAPVAVTDNDTMDTLPAVCANGEEVTVVWLTNTEDDILGLSGTNAIEMAVLGSQTQTVASGLTAVTALSAGYANGAAQIAWVVDADNDLQTLEDWELYLDGEQLTDNEALDSNPVFVGDQLYYYSSGNIICRDLVNGTQAAVFEEGTVGLTDAFTVAANESGHAAIWWSGAVEGGTEVFCTLSTEGDWSELIQFTAVGNQCRYPTGVLEADGSMYLAFCNSIWEDGDIVQNDLYTLRVMPSYDLSVENVYVDETTMMVYATVRNNAELAVEGYTVTVSDDTYGINNTLAVSEPLKAGASAEVQIEYLLPANMYQKEITLSVEADGAEEYDLDNNTAYLLVGNCDIEIADIESYERLPMTSAVATVSNVGYSDTGEITVCLRKETADGEVFSTQTVQNLAAGESAEVTFEYSAVECDNALWYVTAQTEMEEMSLGNNDAYFVNEYAKTVDDYVHDVVWCEMQEDVLVVSAYAENNTAADLRAAALLAIYDANGALQKIAKQDVTVPTYGSLNIAFSVQGYTLREDDDIRLLLCREHDIAIHDDGTHSVTAACVCGETVEALDESCSYNANNNCSVCGRVKLTNVGMELGNELKLQIKAYTKSFEEGKTYYAKAVWPDGKTSKLVPMDEWTEDGTGKYVMKVGIAAKEMTEDLTLMIVDEEGNLASTTVVRSARTYGMGQVDKADNPATLKTLIVDMLNYGAEAQVVFDHKADDLANNQLTEEQQALATGEVTCTAKAVQTTNSFGGSGLDLEDRIVMRMILKQTGNDGTGINYADPSTLIMEYDFVNYLGEEVKGTIDGSEFVVRDGDLSKGYYAYITDLACADTFQMVHVKVYAKDAPETILVEGSDSIEAVAGRTSNEALKPIYAAIMKFGSAARAYLWKMNNYTPA